jgi:hypothetical protein
MNSMTLNAPQPRLRRLGALLHERRLAAAARRQHDAILQDPRMASEHAAAATWAETNGRGSCPYCR